MSSTRRIKGGSWFSSARLCRSAFRGHYHPSDRYLNFGFRLKGVVTMTDDNYGPDVIKNPFEGEKDIVICDECSGDGFLYVATPDPMIDTAICPKCNGNGEVVQ